VEFRAAVTCSKCKQAIVSGQRFGFVCFKIPRKDSYRFFHRGLGGEGCWEAY